MSSAAIVIGKKASQLRSRIATEAMTVITVTRTGTRKSRRISSIGRFTAACQASTVSSEDRAPPIHAVSGRSRLSTRKMTNEIPTAVRPSVTARILRKSPLETS